MAYPMERGERVKRWKIFNIDEPSRNTTGINWKVFFACFEIAYGRFYLSARTPWFMVMLSSGDRDWNSLARWYGLRVHWGHVKNWQLGHGAILFTRGDTSLSFLRHEWMREY